MASGKIVNLVVCYQVMREGRYWQVWDTQNQQCKGQFWAKKAAQQHANDLANGIDKYELGNMVRRHDESGKTTRY